MPTVLIDADGCPVVDLTIRLYKGHGVAVLILCDTAHRIERGGAPRRWCSTKAQTAWTLRWSIGCVLGTSW